MLDFSVTDLHVLVATPFGEHERGGIDRLMDLLIDTIRQRPELKLHTKRLVTRGPGHLSHAPLTFARALAEICGAKLRQQVNVLHINLAAGGSAYRKAVLARVAQSLAIPYVVHLHGSRFHQFWPSASPYWARAVDHLFRESAEIVVLGRFWENLIVNRLPEVKKKITVLPNATAPADTNRYATADACVRITFLGELGPRKGTPQLIEALGRLAGWKNWNATVAGNGDVDGARTHVARLGISDRVEVPGWLGAAAVKDVLGKTDVFVLPSFAENLPMAILEAFARGIPVIATPVGSIPEVVRHGRNGLIVQVGDVDGLADALKQLISNCDLRRKLGIRAKLDHSTRYDVHNYVSEIAAIWRRAARSRAV